MALACRFAVIELSLFIFLILPPLAAQSQIETSPQPAPDQGSVEAIGPREQVRESAKVLQDMRKNRDLRPLLDEAQGIFVIPEYGTAALVIGAAGGEGVLLSKRNGEWARPSFYDVGSLSAGLQAGVAAGAVAMLLMSEEALDAFRQDSALSLTADAGLSIVDWSAQARGEPGEGKDIVVWTDTEGLFAGLALGINNITWDEKDSAQYYGQITSPQAILSGEVQDPNRNLLQQALREP